MYMNYNNDFDKDFILACELLGKSVSHNDMIEMLKHGNVPEKQFAALSLDNISNFEEGEILVKNLTGCDGKIREAAALKINKLLNENNSVSNYFNYPKTFADATIDINANICRTVINSVFILKKNPDFTPIYIKKIIEFAEESFNEIDKFIFKDKKYVINKQLFKLYWCLEALKLIVNDILPETLLKILERASLEQEYTIREKVAQILVLTKDEIFNPLKEKIQQDENYYVKTVFGKESS